MGSGKNVSRRRERKLLAERIRRTFADLRKPSGEPILDGFDGSSDAEPALVAFGGRPWEDLLEPDLLFVHSAGLIALRPPHFRYYFPAYLLTAVEPARSPTSSFSGVEDVVGYCWVPEADAVADNRLFSERMGAFTPQERALIRDVLEYLGRVEGRQRARRALRRYWDQQ